MITSVWCFFYENGFVYYGKEVERCFRFKDPYGSCDLYCHIDRFMLPYPENDGNYITEKI